MPETTTSSQPQRSSKGMFVIIPVIVAILLGGVGYFGWMKMDKMYTDEKTTRDQKITSLMGENKLLQDRVAVLTGEKGDFEEPFTYELSTYGNPWEEYYSINLYKVFIRSQTREQVVDNFESLVKDLGLVSIAAIPENSTKIYLFLNNPEGPPKGIVEFDTVTKAIKPLTTKFYSRTVSPDGTKIAQVVDSSIQVLDLATDTIVSNSIIALASNETISLPYAYGPYAELSWKNLTTLEYVVFDKSATPLKDGYSEIDENRIGTRELILSQ